MRRWLLRAAGLAILIWSVAVAALLLFRHDLLYPFRDWPRATQAAGIPGVKAVTVTAVDGTPLTLWTVAPRPGHPVILHFVGNAGSLPSAGPRLSEYVYQGYGIVALNYRGAGGAPGAPSQDAIVADALLAYDSIESLLGEHGLPVIYGTSLGAAVAVQVASRRASRAVILQAPFNRLCETAQIHYPWAPVCLLLWDERWDSADAIGAIRAPLLIQHGGADQVIPVAQARGLFAAAQEPKRLIVYPDGRHNDLRLYGAGTEALGFLEDLLSNE